MAPMLLQALRYRAEDVARSVTKTVIKEVRRVLPNLVQTYWLSVWVPGAARSSSRASPITPALMCFQARAKELRLEMLNSERLKQHFEERPGNYCLCLESFSLSSPSDGPTSPIRNIQYLAAASRAAHLSCTGL